MKRVLGQPLRHLVPSITAGLALVVALLGAAAPSARADNPTNPLAGHRLGVTTQTDAGNAIYTSYLNSTGNPRTLYGRAALTPRARWYGKWTGTGTRLEDKLRRYIANAQAGDPSVVVPITFFRMWPRGEGDRNALSTTDQAEYKAWYAAAARAIGSSRVAVILEPDLPLILKSRHGTADQPVREALARYAAQTLGSLPNTSVYLDAGSADWLTQTEVRGLLSRTGIQYVRGFALGATHYDSTEANLAYGRSALIGLNKMGFGVKHFVVDTADNGRPFTHAQYSSMLAAGTRSNHFDNADVCPNLTTTQCVTYGIPSTTDVANPKWGMSSTSNTYAGNYADAYLWFGRPWLKKQADPYCDVRALQAGRTTPYQGPAMPQVSRAAYDTNQAKCYAAP